jgi:hypothetical protein
MSTATAMTMSVSMTDLQHDAEKVTTLVTVGNRGLCRAG